MLRPLLALLSPWLAGIWSAFEILGSATLRRRFISQSHESLTAIGPFVLVTVLLAPRESGQWLAHGLLLTICATLPFTKQKRASWWLAALIILIYAGIELRVNSDTFARQDTAYMDYHRAQGWLTGTQTLTGNDSRSNPWYRDWELNGTSNHLLSLNIRTRPSGPVYNWYSNENTVETLLPNGNIQLQFTDPKAIAWQNWVSSENLGGRTFALQGKIFGLQSTIALEEICPAIRLRVEESPWVSSCNSVFNYVGNEFDLEFVVPPEVAANTLRIEVAASEVQSTIQLGNIQLTEVTSAGTHEVIEAIAPAHLILAAELIHNGVTKKVLSGRAPDSAWGNLSVDLRELGDTGLLRSTLRVPQNLIAEVQTIQQPGATAISIARPSRASAWFGYPNLLAHTIVGVFLVANLHTLGLRTFLPLILLTGPVVVLTGSRSGFVGMAAAVVIVIIQHALLKPATKRNRIIIPAVLLAIVAATVLTFYMGQRGANLLADVNKVSRPEIWLAAIEAILASPWFGWQGDSAHALARGLPDGTFIAHAHNFWLQMGVQFGILGLATAIWFSVYCAKWALRIGFAHFLSIMLIFALNIVDYSLATPWMWLMLGLLLAPMPESRVHRDQPNHPD